MPNTQYKTLGRFVQRAWHYVDYDAPPGGEKHILNTYVAHLRGPKSRGWTSDYRGMFSVSRDTIRQHDAGVYADIGAKIRNKECSSRNCCMETFFAALFGCNPHLFAAPSCESGTLARAAHAVVEGDFRKDSAQGGARPVAETRWRRCGDRTILYGESAVNGLLLCIGHEGSADGARRAREDLARSVAGEVWRANATALEFKKTSQWRYLGEGKVEGF